MGALKKNTIRIRMYRVGFGDCFLVSLPTGDGHAHILVDCGVHAKGDIGTIQKAVADVCTEAGHEFAIIIATHAHQDHISGFGKCEAEFKKCKVREVWMPWTEDPKDKTATRMKTKTLALVEQLQQHFAARPASPAAQAALTNLSGNQKALQFLKSGINNGTVRYLDAGSKLNNPGNVQGLSVRVLGPPRDQQFLAKMDPPKSERFLRLSRGGVEPLNGVLPFIGRWIFTPKSLPQFLNLNNQDRERLKSLAGDPEALAFTLDQAMNNTSVVTLLAYRGKYLLLPGDAQYGNWDSWLGQSDSQELLAEVNFYKVAHHGSFNATPKKALEKMTKGRFAAMASTQEVPWPSIPLPNLVKALQQKASGFVRSDSIQVGKAPRGPVVKQLPRGFSQGEFWFDYEILVS